MMNMNMNEKMEVVNRYISLLDVEEIDGIDIEVLMEMLKEYKELLIEGEVKEW